MSVSYLQTQYIDDISNNTSDLKQYAEFKDSISKLDASLELLQILLLIITSLIM